MYELIQISDTTYYFESPAKIGLVKTGNNEVCLIDSGSDKDAGRKVRKALDENGWTLTAIYNTHSNADHIGGNAYLQKQTGCKIYSPGIECAMTCHPILEPAFLYGGYPHRDLRHKFLLAQESDAEYLTETTLPKGFELLRLPGHFFDMVGFRTPDNIVFLADALSSRDTLEKYQISFLYDVAAYLDTLEYIKNLNAKMFVPAHAKVCDTIKDLAQFNIDKVNTLAEYILVLCKEPLNFEQLLKKLFDNYNLTMTYEQHVLIGSTVKSYLSWLKDLGRIGAYFEDNLMYWKTV